MAADEVKDELTGQGAAPADAGRHRLHRSPARGHAMKVLYGDDEWELVVRAAQMLGLRPSSYVASAALSAAQLAVHPPQAGGTGRRRWAAAPAADRELLLELMQARAAVNRYGVNVNQAVAALHSVGHAPVWLEQAVTGARRAVERVDEATSLVARRLTRGTGTGQGRRFSAPARARPGRSLAMTASQYRSSLHCHAGGLAARGDSPGWAVLVGRPNCGCPPP